MPFQHGRDKIGTYIRWGNKGKKYYYDDQISGSYLTALEKAHKQMQAISINKRRSK